MILKDGVILTSLHLLMWKMHSDTSISLTIPKVEG